MIKPEDLRIGNWVLYSETNEYVQVMEVMQSGLTVKFKNETTWIEIYDFEPIPLTEKILLDCGFEEEYKSPFHSVYFKDGISCYFWYDKKKQYLNISGLHIDCDNVHTLQNIYYLIKKTELIIKL